MKTNTQKNQEHDQRQQAKIRPSTSGYDFEPLQTVINSWIKDNV